MPPLKHISQIIKTRKSNWLNPTELSQSEIKLKESDEIVKKNELTLHQTNSEPNL